MSQDPEAAAQGFQPLPDSADPYVQQIGPFYVRHGADGGLCYAFRVRSAHTGTSGIAHNGLLMGFADAAITAFGGGDFAALSMSVSFLGAARINDLVTCQPRISRRTREVVFISAICMAGSVPVMSVKSLCNPLIKADKL